VIQFFNFWPFVRQNQPHFAFLGHPAKVKLVANDFSIHSLTNGTQITFLNNVSKILPDPSNDQVSEILANHQTKSVLS
jgi:hypothetical protein